VRRVRRPIAFRAAAGVNPRVVARPHPRVHTRGYAPLTDRSLATDPASAFARIVAEQINGPVLPYSTRSNLLALAARRGIGRFEANLIIALVQHRRGEDVGVTREDEPAGRRGFRVPAIAVSGVVQSLILLYGWWVLG
jgi:hypothetical protein